MRNLSSARGWIIGLATLIATAGMAGENMDAGKETSIRDLARVKREQAEAHATSANLPMLQIFTDYLTAVEQGRVGDANALYARIRSGAVQYADVTNPAPEQHTALFQYIIECSGVVDQLNQVESMDLWRDYARALFAGMPAGSAYFGGTDPGRFIPTAIHDLEGAPDVIILTQNALADSTYMEYARHRFADRIQLPDQDYMSKVFQTYVEEVKAGRMPKDADIEIKDGKATVKGVMGVMAINGMLSRMIFDSNKDRHAFFVEESFVIPWMYPYMEPHGPILRLAPEPRESISSTTVKTSRRFWAEFMKNLNKRPGFDKSVWLRSSLSKCRAAQAGVYEYRQMWAEAEAAYREAIAIYPYGLEGNYRLVSALSAQGKYAEACKVLEEFLNPTRSYSFTQTANSRTYLGCCGFDAAGIESAEKSFSANPRQNPYTATPESRRQAEDLLLKLKEQAGKTPAKP